MFFFTGVDSTTLEMSLSTAWRDRRALTEQLASAEIDAFFAQVQESGDRILVQFDEKELEEDIDGKLVKRVRLAVVFSSPWLKLEQLICVIPMDCKTGILLLHLLCTILFLQERLLLKQYMQHCFNIPWRTRCLDALQTQLPPILDSGLVR